MSVFTTQSQNISSTSLYVGDLHPLVAESFLYTTFSEYGPIVSARICRDVSSHVSLGYGYVNFENPKDAENAIQSLNYTEIYGQRMRIMLSQRDPSLRKSGQLYETFSQFGKNLSYKIALDEINLKGYGFIHFEDENCAQVDIKCINDKMINDRIIYDGPFIAKTDRPSNNMKMKCTNCYVKNFSEDLSDQGFYDMFVEFGEIKSFCIMRDNGRSKGFGFVCFTDPAFAEFAIHSMNGKSIDDHSLYVNRAQSKAERHKLLRTRFEKQRVEPISRYAQCVNLYIKNIDDFIDDNHCKPLSNRDYSMQMNIKDILQLSVEDQRQQFGEIIFLKIHKTHPSMSRKFTGMFIEMDIPDLRKLVESDDFYNNKIREAIQVLNLHNDHADHANNMDPNSESTR